MNTLPKWGPTHHDTKQTGRRARITAIAMLVAFVLFIALPAWTATVLVVVALLVTGARFAYPRIQAASSPTHQLLETADPLAAVLERSRARNAGVYLGTDQRGEWVTARPERAVLLLGPPRSGKTSGVMVPAVLSHPGPAVCASTKPDVLTATMGCRARLGRVWEFDPTGEGMRLGSASQLRWSPVTSSGTWDGALLMARAMVTGSGVGAGTTDSTHWAKRASALLAPLLHAAALSAQDIATVAGWALGHDLDTPAGILKRSRATLAAGVLAGLQNTEARERSSIFSAAADALEAYSSTGALAAARQPNFDAAGFARSNDSLYIHAPAEHQALAAPLVCGLLSEIRAATYAAHRERQLPARVLFALDEAANIAPLSDLPQIASEGGGQGLQLLAAFQDLSQARVRWGPAADGFLTLFGTKLILPGIADNRTIEGISVALGEYDREMVSTTKTRSSGFGHKSALPTRQTGKTISTQRQRILSPGEIAGIPAGKALQLDGVAWQLISLTAAHSTEPWRTLTAAQNGR